MCECSHIVFWNNKPIGVISNAKVDNFEFYGAWKATENIELYTSFLEEVDSEYGAFVVIGEIDGQLTGNVLVEPDDEIDIRMSKCENNK